MKSIFKNALTLGAGAALLLVTSLNNTVSASTSGPPIRIGLRFGYYGGYYRPVFPAYYGWGYPHIGFTIGVLPLGYVPFYFGSSLYYYHDGVYYRPYNNGYQVAMPPVGAEVPALPAHARAIMIDGMQYYTQSGVYYKPETKADGTQAYIVAGKDGVLNTRIAALIQPTEPTPAPQQPAPTVGPPTAMPPVVAGAPKVGDKVNQLPDGCKSINIAGKTYFVSPDQVYYEQTVEGKNIVYKVQGTPSTNSKQ
jgi:hypothetical protein